MIPAAVVVSGPDGVEVLKVAPLRLSVLDGPALRVSHADASVLIDGEPDDDDYPLSTATLAEANGGGLTKGGLAVDPRKLGDAWAYEIKAEGRRIVWAPTAKAVPSWAADADLFIGPAERGDFAGRLAAAEPGTTFLLRRGGLARKAADPRASAYLDAWALITKDGNKGDPGYRLLHPGKGRKGPSVGAPKDFNPARARAASAKQPSAPKPSKATVSADQVLRNLGHLPDFAAMGDDRMTLAEAYASQINRGWSRDRLRGSMSPAHFAALDAAGMIPPDV